MSGFVVLAGLLTLAALGALLYPLVRGGQTPARRSAGITALVLVVGATGLYPVWSNYRWDEPQPAIDSPAAMVGRLARRLERQPDDLQGWLLLGRSYTVIGQHPLAVRAYQRADKLAEGKSAEAAIGLAEALFESGRSDLAGRSGRLFEQALALDANSTKALFFSAMAAMERNELPLARERFMRLLIAGNPPPDVRDLIFDQIEAIDAMRAMAEAAPSDVSVPLHVTLSPAVADRAEAGAPLFVVARTPGQAGPPLAAKRLQATFPQDIDLLASDGMMGGAAFAAGQELEIEVRVANGGSATSRSGDPYGVARLKAGEGERLTIEINQLKP